MQRDPPPTEEGWYVLHDARRVDWDAWRDAPERERNAALVDGVDYFEHVEAVADSDEGQSAVYSVLGHDADLLVLHLRPTMADIDAAARQFEQTAFAEFTQRADSYVSVTEASGYSERGREYIEGDLEADSGLAKYMDARLHPEIPDDEFVCFYPMDKRRQPEQNWYDLPFEERAEHVQRHGQIGREHGHEVTQMIGGSMGLDDWEWGITLWAEDVTEIKRLLARMRFDQSTSLYAEFGPFTVGRRFPPADLPAFMAGERVPTDGDAGSAPAATGEGGAQSATPASTDGEAAVSPHAGGGRPDPDDAGTDDAAGDAAGGHPDADAHPTDAGDHPTDAGDHPTDGGDHPPDRGDHPAEGDDADHPDGGGGGRPDPGDASFQAVEDVDRRLRELGMTPGEDFDDGDVALVFYSDADAADLADELAGLRENFDHYERHVSTEVRAAGGRAAAVSVWTAREAAETAAGFLGDLPGVEERYGGPLGEDATVDADDETAAIRDELADLGVYAGQPHGEDVVALVLYSDADPVELDAELDAIRDTFGEDHRRTSVYRDAAADTVAVVSLWDTHTGADRAAERLLDLPDVREREADGFSTMGMFYRVKPDYREEFRETFETVGEKLAEMDGHRETTLLHNREDENDLFIASNWDSKEDAMEFFRSDEFADTVEWGREVLEGQPRHVFLA